MGALAQDLRYALRQLRKNPGFALTSIIILALGICASVAIFGFVDAALIKPLPYSDPSRLVWVTESVAMIPRANLSFEDYVDWKKLNQVFSSFDIYQTIGYLLTTGKGTEPVPAVKVSDGFFRTLGVSPFLGRDFHPGEDQPAAPQTVMLSFSTWQKRFGARQDVVGQTVTLSGVPHTIIGVLPANFQFAPLGKAEFWTTARPIKGCDRGCHSLIGIARLKDGVSVDAARANIQAIAPAAGAAVSQHESWAGRVCRIAGRADRSRHPARIAGASGRCGTFAAHRMRQRVKPAASALGKPEA